MIDALGRVILGFLEDFGRFALSLVQVGRWTFITVRNWVNVGVAVLLGRPHGRTLELRETVDQMVTMGVNSVPVAVVTAFFTGMVLALQTGITLERKLQGVSAYLGGLVSVSMLRELGPVLTSLIITGRVGSAMAAEIGTMRVTEQVDALETLATNPVKYLVVPRVLALVCMLPMLALFADAVGVTGGFLIASARFGQSFHLYLENAQAMVVLSDLFSGMLKTAVFGFIIATVSCYKGFHAAGGAEGVGRATTSAVVISSMGILIADYFLTAGMSLF